MPVIENKPVALIPPKQPDHIDVKENIRQAGFTLKKTRGHFLVFRASSMTFVDGWSQSFPPSEYSDEFVQATRTSTFHLYKVAVNRWKPQREDIYVLHIDNISRRLQALFNITNQEFMYNGTDSAKAPRVASEAIEEMAGRINASQ